MRTMYALLAAALAAACSDDDPAQPDELVLPGDAYYPESLFTGADDTLYVGSLATGQVVAFADGETEGRVVVDASSGVTGVAGVTIREGELWLCSIDISFQRPTEVKSFTLDGDPLATYPFGEGRFCNDLAFDDGGALYITDSFSGTVLRLAPGADALEPWLEDPSLAPAMPGGFGLDGLAVVPGAVYLNTFDTGALVRIPIADDGSAGSAQPITVSPALAAPDGMRALDDSTLLIAEGAGRLTKVTVSGTTAAATPLASDLDQPTGIALARGSAWVTEGQLARLFAMPPEPPNLPFLVRRLDL